MFGNIVVLELWAKIMDKMLDRGLFNKAEGLDDKVGESQTYILNRKIKPTKSASTITSSKNSFRPAFVTGRGFLMTMMKESRDC